MSYKPEETVERYIPNDVAAERCVTCKFANTSPFGVYGVLECRRYAPRPEFAQTHRTAWPTVDAHNWCGEWEGKRGT